MKKHISYPKIKQFREVISNINREVSFIGLDGSREALYSSFVEKPTLKFKGTVKLHGTNASVCFNSKDGFWIQSRNNIITPEKDNAGFAFFAENRKSHFQYLIDKIIDKHQIDTDKFTVSLYGEWAGKGIQKNVGISELEKAFYIFGVKISNPDDDLFNSYWLDSSGLENKEADIYNVESFETYSIAIDFNNPQLAQNKLIEITEQIEKECPVSKSLGVKGIGEGVVWSAEFNGNIHRFKVKGEKHSATKVKKLAEVDVEKLNNIREFIEYSVTDNRITQGISEVYGTSDLDMSKFGDLIRWVLKDIISEESDTMMRNHIVPKDIGRDVSQTVKKYFMKLL